MIATFRFAAVLLLACAPTVTAHAADSAASPAAAWPDPAWWRGYGDPQLAALIETGLREAPSLAVAEARLKRAQALVGQARAPSLPRLAAGATWMHIDPGDAGGLPTDLQSARNVAAAGVLAGFELDLWGRYRNAAAAARSDARATAADVAAARLLLSTEIAHAYGELAAHYARHDVLLRGRQVRDETLSVARRRFADGLDGRADVALAETADAQAAADLAASEEPIALTRIRLAALIGAGPDRGDAIARPPPARLQPFGLPQDLPAQLLGRRPDVAAARWRAQAAQHRVREARAAYYPNVNLLALAGLQSLGANTLFDAGSGFASAGPAITLPLLDGGRRRAHVAVSRADDAAALAAYEDVLSHALADVAGAVASQQALVRRLEAGRGALVASRQAWEAARRRYDAGDVDYRAVLAAEDRMLAEQAAVAALEARGFSLDVALVRALGGGWREGG